MGFFEDDRIRRKNQIHVHAYNTYSDLRSKLWSNGDIKSYALTELERGLSTEEFLELMRIACAHEAAGG